MQSRRPYSKKITESDVIKAIEQIAMLINQGYGIVLARKKVTGGMNNRLTRAMFKHDLYVYVLNDYMKNRGYHARFFKTKLGLVQRLTRKASNEKQTTETT